LDEPAEIPKADQAALLLYRSNDTALLAVLIGNIDVEMRLIDKTVPRETLEQRLKDVAMHVADQPSKMTFWMSRAESSTNRCRLPGIVPVPMSDRSRLSSIRRYWIPAQCPRSKPGGTGEARNVIDRLSTAFAVSVA
jgi:hypothetical protein